MVIIRFKEIINPFNTLNRTDHWLDDCNVSRHSSLIPKHPQRSSIYATQELNVRTIIWRFFPSQKSRCACLTLLKAWWAKQASVIEKESIVCMEFNGATYAGKSTNDSDREEREGEFQGRQIQAGCERCEIQWSRKCCKETEWRDSSWGIGCQGTFHLVLTMYFISVHIYIFISHT